MNPTDFLISSIENLVKQFASNRFSLYFNENNLIYTIYAEPESLLNKDGVIFEHIKKIESDFFSIHPEYLLVWQHEKPEEEEILLYNNKGLLYQMFQPIEEESQDMFINYPTSVEIKSYVNLIPTNILFPLNLKLNESFNYDFYFKQVPKCREIFLDVEPEKDYSQAA